MPLGKKAVEAAFGEALNLYVSAVRMIVLGTILLHGGTKDDGVKISLNDRTVKVVTTMVRDLIDHVIEEYKTLKKGD